MILFFTFKKVMIHTEQIRVRGSNFEEKLSFVADDIEDVDVVDEVVFVDVVDVIFVVDVVSLDDDVVIVVGETAVVVVLVEVLDVLVDVDVFIVVVDFVAVDFVDDSVIFFIFHLHPVKTLNGPTFVWQLQVLFRDYIFFLETCLSRRQIIHSKPVPLIFLSLRVSEILGENSAL